MSGLRREKGAHDAAPGARRGPAARCSAGSARSESGDGAGTARRGAVRCGGAAVPDWALAARALASPLSLTQTSLLQLSPLAIGLTSCAGTSRLRGPHWLRAARRSCSDYHISASGGAAAPARASRRQLLLAPHLYFPLYFLLVAFLYPRRLSSVAPFIFLPGPAQAPLPLPPPRACSPIPTIYMCIYIYRYEIYIYIYTHTRILGEGGGANRSISFASAYLS